MSPIRSLFLTALFLSHSLTAAPIHDIAAAGDCKKLKALLKKRANLAYERDGQGRTPLHYAAQEGRLAAVQLLVSATGDAGPEDAQGWMPLHVAALTGQEDTVALLLKKQPQINFATKDKGWTPLHLAIGRGHLGMASLLVARGADLRVRAQDGITPLHTAVIKGH